MNIVHAPDMEIPLQDIRTQSDIEIVPQKSSLPDGTYLQGGFYFLHSFGKTVETSITNKDRYQICQDLILPRLSFPSLLSIQQNDPLPDDLTIHIRSGDIFSGKPHRSYTQPPLSFYIKIVSEFRERHPNAKINIVTEDLKNPCTTALMNYLDLKGIGCHYQSGSLEEDAAFLLKSRHVAFGYGTFGYGLCLLAKSYETVYVFNGGVSYVGLPSIQELRTYDAIPGSYIGFRRWRNTDEQRELMLSLPLEKITEAQVFTNPVVPKI